ncbi:hypothetical protein ABT026_05385 [Streptomyces sp. NPDC002734]|uniref:DUF7878 domain-containing protein n=1 Tax=Streptomyces sp. NPDC002734 TaxID=3154426 RepID=UPI003331BAB9
MSVQLAYRNLGMPDLYRRGLRPWTAGSEVLLVDIEADLFVQDGSRVVCGDVCFPVAELARELVHWLRRPDGERGDFAFDSQSYPDVGEVLITASAEGWRIGSVSEPDVWTSPVAWEVLATEVGRFVTAVRDDVTGMGVRPGLIPDL